MAADTSIEWTDKTWNPVRGCALVSPGCTNCYAMKFAHRFSGPGGRYEGLTVLREQGGPVWSRHVRFVPEMLGEPLRWKKPQKVFVNSMSDLFHEDVTDEQIAAVFGVMAACPQHTFQVLTKRAERMARWFEWIAAEGRASAVGQWTKCHLRALQHDVDGVIHKRSAEAPGRPWPLPNVWLGVSVEDQQRADERIPHLLSVPAAVRFLSCEPLLGPLDLTRVVLAKSDAPERGKPDLSIDALKGWNGGADRPERTPLHWVIVGGESGHQARPCAMEWPLDIRQQCAAAGVPFFFKQAGSNAYVENSNLWPMFDDVIDLAAMPPAPEGVTAVAAHGLPLTGKGGDLNEVGLYCPEVCVREWPAAYQSGRDNGERR